MSYLLAVPVADGADEGDGGDGAAGVVVFEVDPGEIADDLVLASGGSGRAVARARASLEEALAGVKPSLIKIMEVLGKITPERMAVERTTVEFGLKVGGETGVIIAKGTAEVNFKVTLSWRPGVSDALEEVEG